MASAWPVSSSHTVMPPAVSADRDADALGAVEQRLDTRARIAAASSSTGRVASSTRKRSGSAAASRGSARTRAWKSSPARPRAGRSACAPRRAGARAGRRSRSSRTVRSGSSPSVAHSDRSRTSSRLEHPAGALVGDRRVEVAVLDDDLAALERRAHLRRDVVGAVGRVEQGLGARGDVAAVVQHDLAELDADLGAAGLARAHDGAARARRASRSSSAACVDLPEPSPPSKVMKRPRHRARLRRAGFAPASCGAASCARGLLGGASACGFAGPLARLSASSCTARSKSISSTVSPRGIVALVSPSVTYGAEPAVLDLDRLAADRVGLELLERARRRAGAVLRLREELERPGEVDVEDLVLARERAGVGALLQVRAVAAVLRGDLVAGLRVERRPRAAGRAAAARCRGRSSRGPST